MKHENLLGWVKRVQAAGHGKIVSLCRGSAPRKIMRMAYAGVFALGLAACSTTTSKMPVMPSSAANMPAPQAGAMPDMPPYRVQVGDMLGVRFVTNPELNEDIAVRPDGRISTAFADDVPAYNRTPSEIAGALREFYRGTLKDPRVTIVVRSFAPNRVYVAGEVNNPGEFVTVGPNLTLSQAIARAGGVRLSGQRSGIFVIRRGPNDVPQSFRVEYLDVISGRKPEADVRLAQYDVVYVPRTGVFEVYTFWNQFIQQFVPVSWGFSYQVNSNVR